MVEASEALRVAAACAGDEVEFRVLVGPYRRELIVHCYRMLGRIEEAEDAVQEAMLRAWRNLGTFEGRSSFRTWLYRIATNVTLDSINRRATTRLLPIDTHPQASPSDPIPAPLDDSTWLGPISDGRLGCDSAGGEGLHSMREHVALAFLAALQRLPARQRVVLILRDVVGWEATEVAELLEMSTTSANSLLARARSALKSHHARPPTRPSDEEQRSLLGRYVSAWESGDVARLVALMKEDATMVMPPVTLWVRGRQAIEAFIRASILRQPGSAVRLRPAAANGQPAFAFYSRRGATGPFSFFGVQVVTLDGQQIAGLTTFVGPRYATEFELPVELA